MLVLALLPPTVGHSPPPPRSVVAQVFGDAAKAAGASKALITSRTSSIRTLRKRASPLPCAPLSNHSRPQRLVRDLEPGLDLLFRPSPNGVLVLNRQDTLEPLFVHRIDQPDPVDPAGARHPVAPPSDVPRVFALDGFARPPVPIAPVREKFDVLGLSVGDAVDVWAKCRDRIDPHPDEMARVVVEIQADSEHPLPELGGVGEVARIAVRVPALHDAVLDDDLHVARAGMVHERLEDLLGLRE